MSKAKQPVKHKVAKRMLTFIASDHGCDIFSSLGLLELERTYRKRLKRAERYQRRKRQGG